MERQVTLAANGQELQKTDVEMLGETSALADDRVLSELFKLMPNGGAQDKLVIPYGNRRWQDAETGVIDSTALVVGGKADGSVRVLPFRALIGPLTAVGTSPVESYRGIRSAVHVGTSTRHRVVSIAANAAGNPRWTLVYATVTPDANGDTATRYKKDPTTLVVSAVPGTVINKRTTVTISTIDGAAAGSPTRPALPADGGGSYHQILAYVWVPNGHTASSTIACEHIHDVAVCAPMNTSTGVHVCAPSNSQYATSQAVDINQGHNQATRPGAYLPSTMVGMESRVILIQRGVSPASHADTNVVDSTIDWRFRFFHWHASAINGTGAGARFASDRNFAGTLPAGSAFHKASGADVAYGQGQSFFNDSAAGITVAACQGVAAYIDSTNLSNMNAAEVCQLYVDNISGDLKYKRSGAGSVQLIIWLTATGPYSNYGAV